jgi:hypothetical protein
MGLDLLWRNIYLPPFVAKDTELQLCAFNNINGDFQFQIIPAIGYLEYHKYINNIHSSIQQTCYQCL